MPVPKLMDQDGLFRYTSGRWLIDEKLQLEQRFVKFNVDSLCREAVSLFSKATKCVCIIKMEGNFNKAFLLTMDDGNEAIAKIPCPNAGTSMLTTASEVATLEFCMFSCICSPGCPDYLSSFVLSAVMYFDSGSRGARLEFRPSKPSRCRVHHYGEGPRGFTR